MHDLHILVFPLWTKFSQLTCWSFVQYDLSLDKKSPTSCHIESSLWVVDVWISHPVCPSRSFELSSTSRECISRSLRVVVEVVLLNVLDWGVAVDYKYLEIKKISGLFLFFRCPVSSCQFILLMTNLTSDVMTPCCLKIMSSHRRQIKRIPALTDSFVHEVRTRWIQSVIRI